MIITTQINILKESRVQRASTEEDIAWQVQQKKYEEALGVWHVADEKLADTVRAEVMATLYFEHGWLCNLDGIYLFFFSFLFFFLFFSFFFLSFFLVQVASAEVMATLYFEHGWLCNLDGIYLLFFFFSFLFLFWWTRRVRRSWPRSTLNMDGCAI